MPKNLSRIVEGPWQIYWCPKELVLKLRKFVKHSELVIYSYKEPRIHLCHNPAVSELLDYVSQQFSVFSY